MQPVAEGLQEQISVRPEANFLLLLQSLDERPNPQIVITIRKRYFHINLDGSHKAACHPDIQLLER